MSRVAIICDRVSIYKDFPLRSRLCCVTLKCVANNTHAWLMRLRILWIHAVFGRLAYVTDMPVASPSSPVAHKHPNIECPQHVESSRTKWKKKWTFIHPQSGSAREKFANTSMPRARPFDGQDLFSLEPPFAFDFYSGGDRC